MLKKALKMKKIEKIKNYLTYYSLKKLFLTCQEYQLQEA